MSQESRRLRSVSWRRNSPFPADDDDDDDDEDDDDDDDEPEMDEEMVEMFRRASRFILQGDDEAVDTPLREFIRERGYDRGKDDGRDSSTLTSIFSDEYPEEEDVGDPHPIMVASFDDYGRLSANDAGLFNLFMQGGRSERNVVVVALAGASRRGKSFMLNYMLRYMQASGEENWKGEEWLPLSGFTWCGGTSLDTEGLVIWSDVFQRSTPDEDQVSVYLMDSQGMWGSSARESLTIFSLCTLLSSVLIYNVISHIQEDDFQNLAYFVHYGRLACDPISTKKIGQKPFQTLIFLVRDWPYPQVHPYGYEGGRKFLAKVLKTNRTQPPELQMVRKELTKIFSEVSCYLMPHPGLGATNNQFYSGSLSELDTVFVSHLEEFIPSVLADDRLVRKRIGVPRVKGREFYDYFHIYVETFEEKRQSRPGSQSFSLPEPLTLFIATAEGSNLAAMNAAVSYYERQMSQLVGPDRPYMLTKRLTEEHNRNRDQAMYVFNMRPKMGGRPLSQPFRYRLTQVIDGMLPAFRTRNDEKNALLSYRAPIAFLLLFGFCYALSVIVKALGAWRAGTMFNLIAILAFLMLILWCTLTYLGKFPTCTHIIDMMAALLWSCVAEI